MSKSDIAIKIRGQHRGQTKWTNIYPTEEALLADLGRVTIPQDRTAPANTFRGYEYIYSFAFYLQKGWKLSEKQVEQAKRLALEIKIANAIEEE